ncbi:pyrimidine-nucleoside phosphorylase [Longirhabdus pacifica]|uniref:pyrimidine-nucleoside phosphorylase n=1 Tax=Longirhabdus pacifica TaxID=2305227 RepID=UPI0010091561|nr:pyrimidine-nucleoside phosphorylase [Longirhabdus pacifica]
MRMVDLIHKKREGHVLSSDEINFVIEGYTAGSIPDYQMSALLMAVCFQGMQEQEVADLTMAMTNSGDTIDLSDINGTKVDKHSTGGVGDKISLIVAPMVAAVGVPVAKMSGRGLGHTGGTVDKLESIPGFQIEMSKEQFIENVNQYKIALVGQSGNLTPADKKMYALRDVTATVESIPLIASSIMSKKIASGADAIVLDVKVGKGAFMKHIEDAKALASEMVRIGKNVGRNTVAVITDMNQPLGLEVGNANEVEEAIDVLKGKGPEDLRILALTISSHMAVLGGIYANYEEAYEAMEDIIHSGKALDTMKQFVEAQGGNAAIVDDTSLLPQAKYHQEVKAEADGYVTAIHAEEIGLSAMLLGAGRQTKEDNIDYAAGITLHKKVGDAVKRGDSLCVLHSNQEQMVDAINKAKQAYTIEEQQPEVTTYVHAVIQ